LGEGGFADEMAAAPPGGFTCCREIGASIFSAVDDRLERRRRRSRSPSGVVADSFTQRKNVTVNLSTPRRQ
jgi:hypothetical protein